MSSLLSSSRTRTLIHLAVQAIFTPTTCILLALGSLILSLVWVFLDFFADIATIDLYSWLPLIILLVVLALLINKNWLTIALTIPLLIVTLALLSYLLLLLGSLVWLRTSIIAAVGIILLLVLNASVIYIMRKVRSHVDQKQASASIKKSQEHLARRRFLMLSRTTLALAITGVFIKSYFWDDPSRRWLLSDLFPYKNSGQKLTLAPLDSLSLQDVSRLTSSIVSEIRTPKTVAEVVQAINDARATNHKISLSGIRHSMGGQALGSHTLHLDMTHLDSVRYNSSDQTVTAGPGATWKQIQTTLAPHDRAVRVMQDSNIFTVGGALSVNAHGKDPLYGSLIESVLYLKLVTADGREIQCDRTQHNDLFSATLGGYGILGIITEVNLKTTQNSAYRFSLLSTPTRDVIQTMETLRKNPANRLFEAHLSVDSARFLTDSLVYLYSEDPSLPQPADDLQGESNIWLQKVVFQASRTGNMGKILRWELEKHLTTLVNPKTISRNTAMSVPVRFLQNPDPQTTDILQEYFIPTQQADAFLAHYKMLIKKYNINLLNVTIRKVIQDTNALVSYAHTDMYGFVVYYKVARTNTAVRTLQAFTSTLIEYLTSIQARYYLCYGSYYTQSQLTSMYPAISTLLALKNQYDPDALFTNNWYEKYRYIA
jgi:decaprenylphospho-beta-D-ribofuranose 2-oxidase